MTCRQINRVTGALVAAGLVVLGSAGLAAADVSVSSADVMPGATTVLDFAVSDLRDVPTTKVEIKLPGGQTFSTVAARPKIGWDTTLVRPAGATTGSVSSVMWTLTDNRFGIAPGAFDVFSVQLGPLPATGPLTFPTVQTYQDQAVDVWTPAAIPVPSAVPPAAPPAAEKPAAEKPKPDNRGRVTAGLAIGGLLIGVAILGSPLYGRRSTTEAA